MVAPTLIIYLAISYHFCKVGDYIFWHFALRELMRGIKPTNILCSP